MLCSACARVHCPSLYLKIKRVLHKLHNSPIRDPGRPMMRIVEACVSFDWATEKTTFVAGVFTAGIGNEQIKNNVYGQGRSPCYVSNGREVNTAYCTVLSLRMTVNILV